MTSNQALAWMHRHLLMRDQGDLSIELGSTLRHGSSLWYCLESLLSLLHRCIAYGERQWGGTLQQINIQPLDVLTQTVDWMDMPNKGSLSNNSMCSNLFCMGSMFSDHLYFCVSETWPTQIFDLYILKFPNHASQRSTAWKIHMLKPQKWRFFGSDDFSFFNWVICRWTRTPNTSHQPPHGEGILSGANRADVLKVGKLGLSEELVGRLVGWLVGWLAMVKVKDFLIFNPWLELRWSNLTN